MLWSYGHSEDSLWKAKCSCCQISKRQRGKERFKVCPLQTVTSDSQAQQEVTVACAEAAPGAHAGACHICSADMDQVGVGVGGKRVICLHHRPGRLMCVLAGGKTIHLVISCPDTGLLASQNSKDQDTLAMTVGSNFHHHR